MDSQSSSEGKAEAESTPSRQAKKDPGWSALSRLIFKSKQLTNTRRTNSRLRDNKRSLKEELLEAKKKMEDLQDGMDEFKQKCQQLKGTLQRNQKRYDDRLVRANERCKDSQKMLEDARFENQK